jgi:hypothetical protein
VEPDQLHPVRVRPVLVRGGSPVIPGLDPASVVLVHLWFWARLLRSSFRAIFPVPPLQQVGVVFGLRREVDSTPERIQNAPINVLAHFPAKFRIEQLRISSS